MNIENIQPQDASFKKSAGLALKSLALASFDLAQGARPWARSVGHLGQIVENNFLIEVIESNNDLALAKSKVIK